MEFRDLKRQYEKLKTSIDNNIENIISSTQFISGEAVIAIEEALAEYTGARYCISCGNGTDAISIALLAYNIGPGDAVFVPDFTFFSSGECPAAIGATPVFVDVRKDTYNIDVESLECTIKKVIKEGKLIPRVVVAVDLFGLPADYDAIRSICNKYNLLLLEDAAQGFGGIYKGRKVCSLGDISTTSFFPAKPLGCYGDGGAIFTDDEKIAALCRSIAVHGKNADDKYDNVRIGMNSRLDTIQAAVLMPKLEAFKNYELEDVNKVADFYTEKLKGVEGLILPKIPDGYYSSWAQYTVQLPIKVNRKAIQEFLKNRGIPTNIYYIKPMHRQGAFLNTYSAMAECPRTDELCERVLCLPIHPYLKENEVDEVARTLKEALYG